MPYHTRFPGLTFGASDLEQYNNHLRNADLQDTPEDDDHFDDDNDDNDVQPHQHKEPFMDFQPEVAVGEAGEIGDVYEVGEDNANEEDIPLWIGGNPADMEWIEFLLGIKHIWNIIKQHPALKLGYKRFKRIVLSSRMNVVEAAVEPYVDGYGYGHLDENG